MRSNNLLYNLSGKQRLFVIIFLLIAFLLSLTIIATDFITTVVVLVFISIIIFISRPVWLPEDYGKNNVRKYSIFAALVLVLSYGFWEQLVQELFKGFIQNYFPEFSQKYPIADIPPSLLFVFLFSVIVVVNYWARDKTVMGIHKKSISDNIPELSYENKVANVVEALFDKLKSIDLQTNWSSSRFTPLDAEVEINTSNGKVRKISDLLSAIKKSKERLLLVLGNPGAGKSVALRKLAQDLCQEVEKTQKIPIYINLKEWGTERVWNEEEPPTVLELEEFVLKNLKNRDIVTARFFKTYYQRLYENGHLYFIMDSFDEIPAVLNEDDDSELIKQLSHVLFLFLKGARSEKSQGILASRVFRKPTLEYQTNAIITIRPLSEAKIVETIKRMSTHSVNVIKEIFTNRLDLANIATNPFSATLITEYIENNDFKLPDNQSNMYEDYIERTLDNCKSKMDIKKVTKCEVKNTCIILADEMFNNYGFEIPVEEVKNKYPDIDIENSIKILEYARLGRKGIGNDNLFSFVHRRFAEYFKVQSLLRNDTNVRLEAIPNDSQQRDALVLYCEVAPIAKAIKIAKFCWKQIKDAPSPDNIKSVHCLRFLRDAFLNRQECINSFQPQLTMFISKIISEKKSLIAMKLAIENIGLLQSEHQDRLLVEAISIDNHWLSNTAIKACREVNNLSEKLSNLLFIHFDKITPEEFIIDYRKYSFSLKISENFAQYSKFLFYKTSNYFILLISVVIILLSVPTSRSLVALLFGTFISIFIFRLVVSKYSMKSLLKSGMISHAVRLSVSYCSLIILADILHNLIIFLGFTNTYLRTLPDVIDNNYAVHIIGFVCFIVSIPIYKVYYFRSNFNPKKNKLIHDLKDSVKFIIGCFLFICFFIFFKDNQYITYLGKALLFFILILVAYTLFFIIPFDTYKKRTEKNKLLKNLIPQNHNRKFIYNTFTNSRYSETKYFLLNYLEDNVKHMIGDYPKENFLSLNSFRGLTKEEQKDMNILITRLAILEEKWRGLN